MLKLTTSYGKKLPVPGHDFSSQSFHASIEIELSDGLKAEDIQTRIREISTMLKASVEQELNGNGNGNGHDVADTAPSKPAVASNGQTATNKQIRYLTGLAGQLGMDIGDLNGHVRQQYGVKGVYDLTKRQASDQVDELKQRLKKAA